MQAALDVRVHASVASGHGQCLPPWVPACQCVCRVAIIIVVGYVTSEYSMYCRHCSPLSRETLMVPVGPTLLMFVMNVGKNALGKNAHFWKAGKNAHS